MTTPDDLRPRLHTLADDAGQADGAEIAGRAITRARAQRRTRVAVLAGMAVTALIAVGVPVVLGALTDSSAPQVAGPVSTPSPTATPTAAGRTQQIAPGLTVQIGPVTATVGTAYPFDVYTHCGFRYATFAGRAWQADPPAPEPEVRTPAPGGVVSYDGYTSGVAVLVTPDRLRFTVTDPDLIPPAGPIDFVPQKPGSHPGLCA